MTAAPDRDGAVPDEHRDRATRSAVAQVVQRMAAARLAKGFVSLGLVLAYGAAQAVRSGGLASDGAGLALGSLAAAGSMLVYGNGAVRRALGQDGPWAGALATALGTVPYAFALYLLAFRGLRPLGTPGEGAGGGVVALLFVLLAGRLLWDLSRLTRLHRLARTMTAPVPGEES